LIFKNEQDFLQVKPDFSALPFSQLKCKNCCEEFYFDASSNDFLDTLQRFAEKEVHGAIKATNVYRCREKNKKVGGAPDSAHLKSTAADIYALGMSVQGVFIRACNSGLFSGVGLYNSMVHVDCKPRKAKTIWVNHQGKNVFFADADSALEFWHAVKEKKEGVL